MSAPGFPITIRSPEHLQKLSDRYAAVTEVMKQEAAGKSWRSACCAVGVPAMTMYRWLRSYQRDGIAGLVPQTHRSGRKPRRSPDLMVPQP